MKNLFRILLLIFAVVAVMSSCSGNRDGNRTLVVDPVDPSDPSNPDDPETTTPISGIFNYPLGSILKSSDVINVAPDATGQNVATDYDGDGIANEDEVISNPFVADYPKIVTRIAAPITMEIRVSENRVSENHSETVEDSGVTNTISNSMEDRQYSQMNQKTTPYVTKESESSSDSHSESYGWNKSVSASAGATICGFGGNASYSSSSGYNESLSDAISSSTSSEKTVFEDVDYTDNLDRNGVAFSDETVEKITKNARNSEVLKNTDNIGPNAGIVRAALFLKNTSVNYPAHIKNIKCTLSFKTPAGKFLPVKTFLLRNDNWSEFEQDVYGDEELGPYTIEIESLNTAEVTNALKNGYTPQISVVSYDISRVDDSNYNPGVDNLKIVEETAKGRTATIRIVGPDMRETFRVCAFDVDENGNVSPGISLKKALFNIFRSRIGSGEKWNTDRNSNSLTVSDGDLSWKAGSPNLYEHTYGSNTSGNKWREFETYIKNYKDECGLTKHIESIKRIGALQSYNPFDKSDNPSYDPNQLLSDDEIYKMRYWYVIHNGRYYEGDLNDAIWAGERYEIICMDVADFNNHFKSYKFTPFQSSEELLMDTRWNSVTNADEFARSRYLGKVYRDDTVLLKVALKESRFLYDSLSSGACGQSGDSWNAETLASSFKTEDATTPSYLTEGIPAAFGSSASGGVNNITVEIDDSDNAEKYQIKVGPSGSTLVYTYEVERELLRQMYGRYTIHSLMKDVNGVTHEFPEGDYVLTVYALGTMLNVSVTTVSINRSILINVTEPNSVDGVYTIPGTFNFVCTGKVGGLEINVSGGSNTEYFMAKIKGPLNNSEVVETEVPVSTGANYVSLVPPATFNESIQNGVSGLYEVEVFPVNKGIISTFALITSFQGRSQYLVVDFDRFTSLKNLRPKKVSYLSGWESVNLEVNFNDGNGWHRVILRDEPVNVNTDIDCRARKYYDRKNQMFYLTFRPPAGEVNPTFNVFSGGRDCSDVYVRISPMANYRDRFWPRGGSWDITASTAEQSYSFWWVKNPVSGDLYSPYSDASVMESVLAGGYSCPLGLGSLDQNNYFFSPYEYRVLGVTAKLDSSMYALSQEDLVDTPDFSVSVQDTSGVNIDDSIRIYDINSTYCDTFEVYYKQVPAGTDIATLADENVYLWNKWNGIIAKGNSGVISNLVANSNYAVALIGLTPNQKASDPGFAPAICKVVSTKTPTVPENTTLNICGDYRSINVANIYSKYATKYIIKWRKSVYPFLEWETAEISADPSLPVSYIINGLSNGLIYDTEYEVQVDAVNTNATPESLSSSQVLFIKTRFVDLDFTYAQTKAEWFNTHLGSWGWYSVIRIVFDRADLPLGAVSYEVLSGTLSGTRYPYVPVTGGPGYWSTTGTAFSINSATTSSERTVSDSGNIFDMLEYNVGSESGDANGADTLPIYRICASGSYLRDNWSYSLVLRVKTNNDAVLIVNISGTVPAFDFVNRVP